MKVFKIISILSFLWVTISGCDKNDDAVAPVNTLDTLVAANSSLSIFNAILSKADMRTFTKGPGPFTLLAPTNDAFKTAGISSEADLNAVNKATLVTLVAYHLLPSSQTTIDIPVGPNATTSTQSGLTIYSSKYNGNTYVNGGKLLTADIPASNGTLHIIDKVLTPPLTNTVGTLEVFPDFKLLVQAINRAAIVATVNTAGSTLLAPNNSAFVAAGLDSTAIANTPAAALSSILRYHIITARLFSPDFKTGFYKTQPGTNLSVDVSSGLKFKGLTNPAAFSTIGTDLLSNTGVIHAINGVLKP